jgi:DNA-binding NarL/FixJ family response regulator
MPLRGLIVDDSELFLVSAVRLLTAQGMQIVGTANDGATALELAITLEPDVAIIDIELGTEDGVDLARRIPRPTKVVLVSAHERDDVAEIIDDTDFAGFLPKRALSAAAIQSLLG